MTGLFQSGGLKSRGGSSPLIRTIIFRQWPVGQLSGLSREPAGRPPRFQCLNFQFQAIASAASSSRVTISSGSKAIGAHAG
jgi:hypothetical protein